ncbi:pyridoxal phosphate-dependent aminotransferase [Aeropyrum pernix]|uniref:pyridoxal phosphate-dependent aminotransferase n=1 Tax=Aeropyrum pernix TaxID=56636 RepID=UPI00130533C0|nr:histidinol-phosphate transaminase [Aeropyrum pernix]
MRGRVHGGRPPPGALDLSSPSNPLGPPPRVDNIILEAVERGVHTRYPDYEYLGFREAVAGFYRIDLERVIPLNGAAEILPLAAAALRPRSIVVVEPNFGDHTILALSAGIPCHSVQLREAGDRFSLEPGAVCSLPRSVVEGSLIVLSNPNNPTGSAAARGDLRELAACATLRGALAVVVDESFADLSRVESVLGSVPEGVIVARSLTKTLALQGLRIGFAYTDDAALAARLDMARQPWNVNSIAALLVERLLGDMASEVKGHIARAIEAIEGLKPRLYSAVSALGAKPYSSQAPFILVRHRRRNPLFARCLLEAAGVYIRDASSFRHLTPYHSRISVAPGVERLERLQEAILDCLSGG